MLIIGFLRAGRQLVYETKPLCLEPRDGSLLSMGAETGQDWPRVGPEHRDMTEGTRSARCGARDEHPERDASFPSLGNPTLDRVLRLLAETTHAGGRRANHNRSVDECEPAAVIPKASCSWAAQSGHKGHGCQRTGARCRSQKRYIRNGQQVVLLGIAVGLRGKGRKNMKQTRALPFVASPCPLLLGLVCLVLARPSSAGRVPTARAIDGQGAPWQPVQQIPRIPRHAARSKKTRFALSRNGWVGRH